MSRPPPIDGARARYADRACPEAGGLAALGREIEAPLCELYDAARRLRDSPLDPEQRAWAESVCQAARFVISRLGSGLGRADGVTPPGSARLRPARRASGEGPSRSPVREACPDPLGRVLVAEDNPVNQLVVVRLLEKLGYEAHCVGNGREALDTARVGGYDAVLMDCQMPEMDGYAATRALRAAGSEVPIIALTASTTEGDRELCFAAGMNDHMTKPVQGAALAEIVSRWVAPRFGAASPPAPPAAVPSRPKIDVASSCLDEQRISALRVLLNEEFPDYLDALIDDAATQLGTVRTGLAEADAGAVRIGAHTLKSTAAGVGANAVAALAQRVEASGAQGDLLAARELVAELDVACDEMRDALASLFVTAAPARRTASTG